MSVITIANGRFKDRSEQVLNQCLSTLADTNVTRLVVHLHGGLVSEAEGRQIANNLQSTYDVQGTQSLFILWNSDLWQTIHNNADELLRDKVILGIARRVAQWVVGSMDNSTRGAVRFEGEFEEVDTLEALQRHLARPGFTPSKPLDVTEQDKEAFKERLQYDAIFQEGILEIAGADAQRGFGSSTLRPSKMDPLILNSIRQELRGQPVDHSAVRGLAVSPTLLLHAAKVLYRVVKRMRRQRDHGLYLTVIEEILRELYFDAIGGAIWNAMKDDTEDAFDAGPEFAGTALLNGISQLRGKRIILVGHSAGSIFIAHLLQAAQRMHVQQAFDIILLAPACTHSLFSETLANAQQRIANFRMFSMCDEKEREDTLVPVLYPGSLLYLVSGVFEKEVDAPLLGMERYLHAPYPLAISDSQSAKLLKRSSVWSVVPNGNPGFDTKATKHGGFDEDDATKASIRHIILNGY